jgi:uncharacterized protein (DUF1015 family)
MEVRPFRGWRYALDADRDVSPYLAPPYDILTEVDKRELLARCERNVVAIDLPHVPPREVGADADYEAAGKLLAEWRATGVLRQDDEPALYVYQQTYTWAGRTYERRALICGVRATELGRDVIPHEHVFPGPLADRLKLTQCTRMQLSPIFGFYDDPQGRVGELLSEAAAAEPVARGELRGVDERLWTIVERETIDAIAEALRRVPAFIADGHHRYTTARNYRRSLVRSGRLDDDHEANFVMFALVSREDPGLLILPTHRIFSNLHESGSVEALAKASPEFSWRKGKSGDVTPADVEAALAGAGPRAMAFVSGRSTKIWVVELAEPKAMHEAAPGQTDEWRSLPPAILHKLIIERALQPWIVGQLGVEYTPEIAQVLEACRSGRAQLGACLPSIPVQAVETIARSGASMPHKSTYFYPKLATGLVLKPVE